MELYWKAAAAALLAVILGSAVGKQEKDISMLLAVAVCGMVGSVVISYLEPVLDFLWELEDLGRLESGVLGILLKALGIGLVTHIAAWICADVGNGSLGAMLQMLGSVAILYLSIPIFRGFLTLIQEILGAL